MYPVSVPGNIHRNAGPPLLDRAQRHEQAVRADRV